MIKISDLHRKAFPFTAILTILISPQHHNKFQMLTRSDFIDFKKRKSCFLSSLWSLVRSEHVRHSLIVLNARTYVQTYSIFVAYSCLPCVQKWKIKYFKDINYYDDFFSSLCEWKNIKKRNLQLGPFYNEKTACSNNEVTQLQLIESLWIQFVWKCSFLFFIW